MTVPPSPSVLAAFGIQADPVVLEGGEGVTFRVGELVVKRVHEAEEAEWTQGLLSRVHQDGFRIPDPVSSAAGSWVHDGWSASRFVRDLRPAAPSWNEITDAGLRFADAAEQVREGGQEILSRRTHRWAVADRVAWAEARAELSPEASDVFGRISILLVDPPTEKHFVHADLSGNVYLDPAGVPVILDVSPCLRARRWAVAIVIADAVLWSEADPVLAEAFASSPTDRDLLGRALIFRMVAEQLAHNPRHEASLQPYQIVLSMLT